MTKDKATNDVVQLDAARAARNSDLQSTRDGIRAHIGEIGLSQTELSSEVGITRQACGHFLAGRFDKAGQRTCRLMVEWFRKQDDDSEEPEGEQSTAAEAVVEPHFVQTVTATRVLNTLAYCHSEGDLGVIYGGPGIGKTFSLQKYQSDYPTAVFIMTASPEVATVHPMLEELARALGLEDCTGGSRAISRAVRDRVKSIKRPLLLIDESQHLNLNALESLRSIHDETRCGMVFVGNSSVYERLTGGSRSAHFAQLFSRLGMQLHLRRPQRQDVVTLVRAYGIEDDDALELLLSIAKRPGALRSTVKVSRLAISAADGNAKGVQLAHVRLAARNLGLEVAT
jgi:hypothetical protein